MPHIYLDNAATTPLHPEVIEHMAQIQKEYFANPSSLHRPGKRAQKLLAQARSEFAQIINSKPEEIIFTSGASEANNTVFQIANYDIAIVNPCEHACVLEAAKKFAPEVLWLNPDEQGFIDQLELENLLKEQEKLGKKALVSIMHANNEIGTIQDLESIGQLCQKYSALFHSDCVQSFVKHKIDVQAMNLDFISVSAHKFHGPKGNGFLFKNSKAAIKQEGIILGGGQEFGLRAGTENIAGILGMAKAASISNEIERKQKLLELSDYFWSKLKEIPDLKLNGAAVEKSFENSSRLIGNFNISLTATKFKSEELVLQMDLAGICIASGSACSSNKMDFANEEAQIIPSYVLRACRINEGIASKAIRISLSAMNKHEDLEHCIQALAKLKV